MTSGCSSCIWCDRLFYFFYCRNRSQRSPSSYYCCTVEHMDCGVDVKLRHFSGQKFLVSGFRTKVHSFLLKVPNFHATVPCFRWKVPSFRVKVPSFRALILADFGLGKTMRPSRIGLFWTIFVVIYVRLTSGIEERPASSNVGTERKTASTSDGLEQEDSSTGTPKISSTGVQNVSAEYKKGEWNLTVYARWWSAVVGLWLLLRHVWIPWRDKIKITPIF